MRPIPSSAVLIGSGSARDRTPMPRCGTGGCCRDGGMIGVGSHALPDSEFGPDAHAVTLPDDRGQAVDDAAWTHFEIISASRWHGYRWR
jgi:hypothetical protein